MDSKFIPNEKISKENILRCVNDGKFGVQSIDRVEIDILDTYEGEYKEFNRTLITSNPLYSKFYCKGIKGR